MNCDRLLSNRYSQRPTHCRRFNTRIFFTIRICGNSVVGWHWKKLTVMAIDHLPGVRSHNHTTPYRCDRLRHFNWIDRSKCVFVYSCVIHIEEGVRCSSHTNTTTSGYRWRHPTQNIDRFEWPNIFRMFAGRQDTIFPQTLSIQRFIMKYESFDFHLKFEIHFRRIFVDEIAKNRKQ